MDNEPTLAAAIVGAKFALSNWEKYTNDPDEIAYQANKVSGALRDLMAAIPPAGTMKELKERRGEPDFEVRPDIQQWQKDQSEFFDHTILEIVGEYAEWRDQRED